MPRPIVPARPLCHSRVCPRPLERNSSSVVRFVVVSCLGMITPQQSASGTQKGFFTLDPAACEVNEAERAERPAVLGVLRIYRNNVPSPVLIQLWLRGGSSNPFLLGCPLVPYVHISICVSDCLLDLSNRSVVPNLFTSSKHHVNPVSWRQPEFLLVS